MDNTVLDQSGNAPAKGNRHPKGLYVLFATEMWERFNYYGMRAVLLLFMLNALQYKYVFASNLYGSYTGLVFLTPLVGGFVADKYWGNKRSIITGGLVMAVGELLLFICASYYDQSFAAYFFFSGLGLVIAGNGFFKPNISSLVGQLYPKGDRRKDAAYTIFYMGINVGGAIGPFVCGLVGDTGRPTDFKWAFLAACIAMLLSVVVQLIFHKKYVVDPEGKSLGLIPEASHELSVEEGKKFDLSIKKFQKPFFILAGLAIFSAFSIGALYVDAKIFSFLLYLMLAAAIFIIGYILSDKHLTKEEKQKVWVIVIVSFFVIFFWSAYEQAGASLTYFAEIKTERNLGFFNVPASWFQSVNSVFIVLFAPIMAWMWLKMGRKEPSSPTKMALGLLLLALGYFWIAFGVRNVPPSIKVSMIWLTGTYALHTIGELALSPIGLSLVNKLAPIKFASLLMAVWFLSNAFANKFAGMLSALYPEKKVTSFLGYQIHNLYDFFMLFFIMAGTSALILFLLTKKLQTMMHEEK